MGLKDKLKKYNEEHKDNGFHPLELNEGNVQAIFNRCIATEETTDYAESILQQKSEGYEQDSNPILFDKKRLLDNLKSIRYLYGQLLTTHKHTNTINTNVNGKTNVMTNYMGNTWITNKGILLQFFHLGVGSDTIYPFSLNGNSMFRNVGITPTLSPKDPAFPAWWEAHKSEWEA